MKEATRHPFLRELRFVCRIFQVFESYIVERTIVERMLYCQTHLFIVFAKRMLNDVCFRLGINRSESSGWLKNDLSRSETFRTVSDGFPTHFPTSVCL